MNKTLVTLLFISISIPSFSQTSLSNEKAIELALTNNLDLKNMILDLETIRMEQNNAISLGNTGIDWNYGELNAPDINDNSISINQDLGNIFQKIAKKKSAKARHETIEQKIEIYKRELTQKVNATYDNWVFYVAQEQLLQSKLEELTQIKNHFNKMYQAGLSNGIETTFIENKTWEENNALIQVSKNKNNTTLELQNLLGISYSIVPNSNRITQRTLSLENLTLNASYSSYFESMQNTKRLETAEKSKQWFPAINLGFTNQQIESIGNNNSINIGLDFGLFNGQSKLTKQKAKLAEQKTENEIHQTQAALENKLNFLVKSYKSYQIKISDSPINTETFLNNLTKSLTLGELDIYTYMQNIESYIGNQISRLENIKIQNEIASQIIYLTNP